MQLNGRLAPVGRLVDRRANFVLTMLPVRVREAFLAVNHMADAFEPRLGSGSRVGGALRCLREEQAIGTARALLPIEGKA